MIRSVVNCINKYMQKLTKQENTIEDFSSSDKQSSFTKRYNCPHNVLKVIVTIVANEKSKQVIAMIDTGCTNTSIPYNVVKFLDLVSSGYQKMNAVNKSYVCNFYICNMIIEDQIQLNDVMVVGLPQLESEDETETPTANEQMILGMDILSKCDFAITNKNDGTEFTIAYPSKRSLDLTNE